MDSSSENALEKWSTTSTLKYQINVYVRFSIEKVAIWGHFWGLFELPFEVIQGFYKYKYVY